MNRRPTYLIAAIAFLIAGVISQWTFIANPAWVGGEGILGRTWPIPLVFGMVLAWTCEIRPAWIAFLLQIASFGAWVLAFNTAIAAGKMGGAAYFFASFAGTISLAIVLYMLEMRFPGLPEIGVILGTAILGAIPFAIPIEYIQFPVWQVSVGMGLVWCSYRNAPPLSAKADPQAMAA
jgi:hypothetical protein